VYGLPVTRLHPLRLLLLVLIAILCPAKASAATAAWIETRVGLASDLLEAIQGGGVPWLTQASTFLSAASAAHAADYGGLYTNTRTTVAIAAVVANPAAILADLKVVQEVVEAIQVETGVARVAAAAEGAGAAARTFTSADPLVGDLANAIERAYPGHVVGVNLPVTDAAGNLVTDVDILLKNAAIQVKSGSGAGLTRQVLATEAATGLPTIGYGPQLGGAVFNGIQAAGGLVTRDSQLLIDLVAP
jgi:hypothetical protein